MDKINKYFNCVYCINLAHRTERLERFKKDNRAIIDMDTVNIFQAVDGSKITNTKWLHKLGALGCRLSHLTIYKEAINKNYSKILVLEDDVVFNKSVKKKLNVLLNYLKDDWDMIYFSGTHVIKPEKINRNYIRLNNTLALHAVAINCRCLPKIISKVEADKRWIDSVIGDLHVELKVFGFLKPVAKQREGFSDVEEKHINYNVSFFKATVNIIKQVVKNILHNYNKHF